MIYYVSGDLLQSPAQTLVNTVNTVGVMGKGIALQFKQAYPAMFADYRDLCESGGLQVGRLHVWRSPSKLIINFPTKTTWRKPSQLDYILKGLATFRENYQRLGVTSVAFPPLGCGNGELNYQDAVRPLLERFLGDLPIPVYLYAPHPRRSPAEHRLPAATKAWMHTAPEELSFPEVWDDLRAILTPRVVLNPLSGSGAPYHALLWKDDEGQEGVRIGTASKSYRVRQEDVRDLWLQLRTSGFLTAGMTPKSQERAVTYLLPLFAALPYVATAVISRDYADFRGNPEEAVHLIQGMPSEVQTSLL